MEVFKNLTAIDVHIRDSLMCIDGSLSRGRQWADEFWELNLRVPLQIDLGQEESLKRLKDMFKVLFLDMYVVRFRPRTYIGISRTAEDYRVGSR